GHHVDASFAGAIHGGGGQTNESTLRADIDNAATPAGRHHRTGDGLAREEKAAQAHRHHFAPVSFGDIEGGAGEAKAGVVDEYVDAPLSGNDARDGFGDRADV